MELEWSENEKREIYQESHRYQITGSTFDPGITDRFPLLVLNLKLLVQVEKKLELDSSQGLGDILP